MARRKVISNNDIRYLKLKDVLPGTVIADGYYVGRAPADQFGKNGFLVQETSGAVKCLNYYKQLENAFVLGDAGRGIARGTHVWVTFTGYTELTGEKYRKFARDGKPQKSPTFELEADRDDCNEDLGGAADGTGFSSDLNAASIDRDLVSIDDGGPEQRQIRELTASIDGDLDELTAKNNHAAPLSATIVPSAPRPSPTTAAPTTSDAGARARELIERVKARKAAATR